VFINDLKINHWLIITAAQPLKGYKRQYEHGKYSWQVHIHQSFLLQAATKAVISMPAMKKIPGRNSGFTRLYWRVDAGYQGWISDAIEFP
jgi:hypothetical protein